MWGLTDENDATLEGLSKVTTAFDNCGAFDGNSGDKQNSIPKGSEYKYWKNALSFLEYYGVQKMDGFGIIIIDDKNLA